MTANPQDSLKFNSRLGLPSLLDYIIHYIIVFRLPCYRCFSPLIINIACCAFFNYLFLTYSSESTDMVLPHSPFPMLNILHVHCRFGFLCMPGQYKVRQISMKYYGRTAISFNRGATTLKFHIMALRFSSISLG